jgi:colanic acid biosynthesis glycosyl transferase WcaI
MNILIITQYFWPENFKINDLAVSLFRRGHHVTVLTGIPNYPEGKFFKGFGWFKKNSEVYQGVKIYRVPLIPRGQGSKILLALNFLSFAVSASILGPLLCRSKVDIIFVYEPSPITVGIPALFFKKIKKAPIFFWVQDLWPETLSSVEAVSLNSMTYKLIGKLVKSIYSRCERILIQSQSFESSIKNHIEKDKRVYYFPNYAEKLYQPLVLDKGSAEFSEMPKGFRVMFAGNIGFAQDFGTIVKAAKVLKYYKDIKWIIIGEGSARRWAEGKISKLGLTEVFHFLGKHPAEKIPRYFSFADALLVTLKKDPIFALTIPSKVQSYLACSKPIVAGLDGEGNRIINEAEAGVTCPSENPEALAEAILKIYHKSDEERKQMGADGRRYFEKHFESEMLTSRLENWMFEELNSSSQGNHGLKT